MFSRKMVMFIGLIALIALNIIGLSITRDNQSSFGVGRLVIALVAPCQEIVSRSIRFAQDNWRHYFMLVSASQENVRLKNELRELRERDKDRYEIELANARLRRLLNFKQSQSARIVAAEVIARDPSPWFRSVVIGKGRNEGVYKGMPVVVAEGVVGQVAESAANYAKVLLITDPNSGVDALVQRTRARGIIQGESADRCRFQYVLRKQEVLEGDTVISSGLDGVFPKGLRIGEVSYIENPNAGIFQEVLVTPFVDFEKIEEVLVLMIPQHNGLKDPQAQQAESAPLP